MPKVLGERLDGHEVGTRPALARVDDDINHFNGYGDHRVMYLL